MFLTTEINKLEVNYKEKPGKTWNNWKLKQLYNAVWLRNNPFEPNENKSIIYQNLHKSQ